jgi:hypothetical protein
MVTISRVALVAALTVGSWLPATNAVASSDPLDASGVVVDDRRAPSRR